MSKLTGVNVNELREKHYAPRDAWRGNIPRFLDMPLNAFARTVGFIRAESGFERPSLKPDRKLMLTVSELCEAQNEMRDGHTLTEIYYRESDGKPESFLVECGDAIIRLLDLMDDVINADPSCTRTIHDILAEKAAFNASRPPKHGRQF